MALSARFTQLNSDLDGFLTVQCGHEKSGAPLSVLSALTRIGVDPWREGSRLSKLPRDVAARELAPLIARFSDEGRVSSEVMTLAERIAALLPEAGSVPDAKAELRRPGHWLACLLLALLALGTLALLLGQ